MIDAPPHVPQAELTVRRPRERIEKRAIAWWMLRALVLWGWPVAVLLLPAIVWQATRVWLTVPIIAAGVVLLAKLTIEPWYRYMTHRWEITDHATFASSGWLVREWRVSPSTRIQTVDAVRGPLERLLGLSTLRITTASSAGAVTIAGLDRTTADIAVAQLAAVAETTQGDAT